MSSSIFLDVNLNIKNQSNNLSSSLELFIEDTTDIRFIFGCLNAFVIIFTVTGCSFFLYLFYAERKYRKIAHNYVISMCLGDIVHGGLGCTIVIIFCTGLKLKDNFCPIATSILLTSVYVSLFSLTTTAIDRFMAVCHPLMYQSKMTHNISYGIITLGWILAIASGAGLLFMRSDKYKEYPNELCLYLSWVYDPPVLFGYLELIMTICVVISVILYIKVYLAIRAMFQTNFGTNEIFKMWKWIKNHSNAENSENIVIGLLKVREVKVSLLMLITVISFILCWMPCIFVVLIYNTTPNIATLKILASYVLPKIYSMMNPILYAYTIPNVRKAFKKRITRLGSFGKKREKKEKRISDRHTI